MGCGDLSPTANFQINFHIPPPPTHQPIKNPENASRRTTSYYVSYLIMHKSIYFQNVAAHLENSRRTPTGRAEAPNLKTYNAGVYGKMLSPPHGCVHELY